MEVKDLKRKAAKIRLDTLTAIHKAGRGHTGSSMSVIEILVALYYGELMGRPVMKFDAAKPGAENRDFLVLSKGQAAPALYSILADLNFIDPEELSHLSKVNSMLQGRPVMKIPGVSATSISHGHGLSVALGIALSLRMDRKDNKVFTVLGDGELQEGQIWEAAMAASNYKLNNLIAFIDNNKVQADGNINAVMDIGAIQDKFESFGWSVVQVLNGHDFDQLLDALIKVFSVIRKPSLIWCHTVIGRGIEFAEGKAEYQDTVLSDGEMAAVIPKLTEYT